MLLSPFGACLQHCSLLGSSRVLLAVVSWCCLLQLVLGFPTAPVPQPGEVWIRNGVPVEPVPPPSANAAGGAAAVAATTSDEDDDGEITTTRFVIIKSGKRTTTTKPPKKKKPKPTPKPGPPDIEALLDEGPKKHSTKKKSKSTTKGTTKEPKTTTPTPNKEDKPKEKKEKASSTAKPSPAQNNKHQPYNQGVFVVPHLNPTEPPLGTIPSMKDVTFAATPRPASGKSMSSPDKGDVAAMLAEMEQARHDELLAKAGYAFSSPPPTLLLNNVKKRKNKNKKIKTGFKQKKEKKKNKSSRERKSKSMLKKKKKRRKERRGQKKRKEKAADDPSSSSSEAEANSKKIASEISYMLRKKRDAGWHSLPHESRIDGNQPKLSNGIFVKRSETAASSEYLNELQRLTGMIGSQFPPKRKPRKNKTGKMITFGCEDTTTVTAASSSATPRAGTSPSRKALAGTNPSTKARAATKPSATTEKMTTKQMVTNTAEISTTADSRISNGEESEKYLTAPTENDDPTTFKVLAVNTRAFVQSPGKFSLEYVVESSKSPTPNPADLFQIPDILLPLTTKDKETEVSHPATVTSVTPTATEQQTDSTTSAFTLSKVDVWSLNRLVTADPYGAIQTPPSPPEATSSPHSSGWSFVTSINTITTPTLLRIRDMMCPTLFPVRTTSTTTTTTTTTTTMSSTTPREKTTSSTRTSTSTRPSMSKSEKKKLLARKMKLKQQKHSLYHKKKAKAMWLREKNKLTGFKSLRTFDPAYMYRHK